MAAGNFFGGQFFGSGFFGRIVTGGGTSKRRRKGKIIRFSDFDSREAYEEAIRAAITPVTVPTITEPIPPLEEDEDDEILIAAISRILH